MHSLLIFLGLGVAAMTLAAILWSIAFPARRIWPPKRYTTLTPFLVWIPTFTLFGVLILLGVWGWGDLAIPSWVRFGVGLPLILIPTTGGTGSELTRWCVITDTAKVEKYNLSGLASVATAALIDWTFTTTKPARITADTAIDSLTHAIEAYVSRKANTLTDPLALQCVEMCANHLRRAWEDPQDSIAREAMMMAATLGGMAFSNSSVCLVHGMSRPVGAVFHLPHGLSNAILLPAVTQFSVGDAQARYATIARTVGCATAREDEDSACQKLIDWLVDLNRDLKLPRLSQCDGVTREVFDREVSKMASDALASGSPSNNPKVPSHEEIVQLYQSAF